MSKMVWIILIMMMMIQCCGMIVIDTLSKVRMGSRDQSLAELALQNPDGQ